MTHDQFQEQLPLYVVGALDGAELREFERYAAESRAFCEPEIAQFQAVADQIAFSAPPATPSRAVFHRTMAVIEDDDRATTRTRAAGRREKRPTGFGALLFRWVPWLATAALAALVVMLNGQLQKVTGQLSALTGRNSELLTQGTDQQSKVLALNNQIAALTARVTAQSNEFKEQTDQLHKQNDQQKQDIEALQAVNNRLTAEKQQLQRIADELRQKIDLADAQVAALEKKLIEQNISLELFMDPAIRVIPMTDPTGATKAVAKAYWHDAKRAGLMVASGLKPVIKGKDKCLELWAMCGKEPPVSAGLFWTDDTGRAAIQIKLAKPAACIEKLAVSVEPANGSPAPTGEMLLLGQ
jgi:anti-sigma-K factor RskA